MLLHTQCDVDPEVFWTHIERVERSIDTTPGLFPELGALAIVAAIKDLRVQAQRVKETAPECVAVSERLSNLEMPRNGNQLQVLIRMLASVDVAG